MPVGEIRIIKTKIHEMDDGFNPSQKRIKVDGTPLGSKFDTWINCPGHIASELQENDTVFLEVIASKLAIDKKTGAAKADMPFNYFWDVTSIAEEAPEIDYSAPVANAPFYEGAARGNAINVIAEAVNLYVKTRYENNKFDNPFPTAEWLDNYIKRINYGATKLLDSFNAVENEIDSDVQE